ncbi:hypothetical protein NFI96_025929 [Prochilodus magdalenae]|nr:hypothetical protein NFI96_025929 [Prochilodus magdalenae]
MIHHPHHTCSVVVLWGSCPLKNRVIQYTEKQMDYSLDLYTYRVSCMVSGADKMDSISYGVRRRIFPSRLEEKDTTTNPRKNKPDQGLWKKRHPGDNSSDMGPVDSCISKAGESKCEYEYKHRVHLCLNHMLKTLVPGFNCCKRLAASQRMLTLTSAVRRWTVRDDSSSAAAQCSVGHPLVLPQWAQDAAHKTGENDPPPTSYLLCGGPVGVLTIEHAEKQMDYSLELYYRVSYRLEHPHTVPADGAIGVEVEGHQAFWTCDYTPFILVLTTVPPHTDSLVVSTKTKAGHITEVVGPGPLVLIEGTRNAAKHNDIFEGNHLQSALDLRLGTRGT